MPYSRGSAGEPQLDVRLDRVPPLVLEPVGPQLVGQADRPALVPADIQDDAASLVADHLHRRVQLLAAVAPERAEHVAGQALRVHAREHVGAVADVAEHHRDMGASVDALS